MDYEVFKYIWWTTPIDFWNGIDLADKEEASRVLLNMPELPRSDDVYKIMMPYEGYFVELFLCKADNNGTTYLFSDFDVKRIFDELTRY